MKENNYIRTAICKKCGKEFIPAPLHIYKAGSKYYCSWTCYNHREDEPKEHKTSNTTHKEETAYDSD